MADSRKNVLFVVNIPSPYRVDFFNELGKKCNLTVAFEGMNASDRDAKWLAEDAVHFHAIYLNGCRVTSERFFCPNVIRLLKADWDHIFLGGYATPTLMLAIEYLRLRKKRFYIEVDGGMVSNDTLIKFSIKRHFVASASLWMSTGKETTDFLVHYGADRTRCIEYPFSSVRRENILFSDITDPIAYERERSLIRDRYKDALGLKNKKVVLAVGQIIPRKGYDILIKAMRRVDMDCQVVIVGGKPTLDLTQLIDSNKIKNVKFIDFLTKEELKDYYLAADVFVHPTRKDIWGLVINEALAYGLPVITTDRCVAGKELIVDGHNGFIAEAGNESCLSAAIVQFFNSNHDHFAYSAMQTALNYTIETMAEKHLSVIEA